MNRKKSSVSFSLISGLLILIAGMLTFMHLEEWYVIGVLGKTTGYPFGGEGPTPYYYKNPELYAKVNLIWGILFSATLTFGITTTVKKNRIRLVTALGTTIILAAIMLAQGMIE